MARRRSKKSSYRSAWGGGFVTAAQRLAELVCERIARRNGQALFDNFWADEAWKKSFLQQLKHANDLLGKYSFQAIANAIAHTETRNCYSLGAKWLLPYIEREQERLDRLSAASEGVATAPVEEGKNFDALAADSRPTFVTSPSTLNKLRGLE